MKNTIPNPVALAHEVLDMAHEDETITVCTIPDNKAATLARAVIAAAELVDRFEAERDTSHTKDEAIAWDYAATLTDAALNGKIR